MSAVLTDVEGLVAHLSRHPASPLAVQLAVHRLDQGDFAAATAALEPLIAACPDYPTAQLLRGQALLSLGDYEGATQALGQAIRVQPNSRTAQRTFDLAVAARAAAEPDAEWSEVVRGTEPPAWAEAELLPSESTEAPELAAVNDSVNETLAPVSEDDVVDSTQTVDEESEPEDVAVAQDEDALSVSILLDTDDSSESTTMSIMADSQPSVESASEEMVDPLRPMAEVDHPTDPTEPGGDTETVEQTPGDDAAQPEWAISDALEPTVAVDATPVEPTSMVVDADPRDETLIPEQASGDWEAADPEFSDSESTRQQDDGMDASPDVTADPMTVESLDDETEWRVTSAEDATDEVASLEATEVGTASYEAAEVETKPYEATKGDVAWVETADVATDEVTPAEGVDEDEQPSRLGSAASKPTPVRSELFSDEEVQLSLMLFGRLPQPSVPSDPLRFVRQVKPTAERPVRGVDSSLLDAWVEQLSQAPRLRPDEKPRAVPPTTPRTAQIVSETMGEIYVRQGEYSKAVDVYEQLIAQRPERRAQYELRLTEIRQLLISERSGDRRG